ncbi:hypothetical protein K505DRAFT_328856 [Melanomma pulvis-pyrius CBS 109.77]|uniref:Uncharacterized protein n=1 Tax=Melanomma pulvis-pyrius CBS 109.77 TaxID=1314802 RepID=A0A6A6WX88_9PLEO|nr:hypothetical protein K505DRAFT_328856 [Melanomma pulvis-pyrius CBS 109.77]
MKSVITLANLLTLTCASALPRHHNDALPQNAAQSIVTVRLIASHPSYDTQPQPQSQQYQQESSSDILTIIVGQTIFRDTNPLLLQGVEVLDVREGVSLSGERVNPRSVVCTAAKEFSSRSAGKFGLGSRAVMFDDGEQVVITRIECF